MVHGKELGLKGSRRIAFVTLVVAAGLYGLWQCVPGFRPKHVRDIMNGLIFVKGSAIAVYFGMLALLIPAARLLRERGVSRTIIGSFFILLSALLTLDIAFGVVAGSKHAALWGMRLFYIAVVVWGCRDLANLRSLFVGVRDRVRVIWSDLPPWWRLFLGLLVFFLIRQDMHLYLYRTEIKGDEVTWWQTGAKMMMNHGVLATMRDHTYGHYVPAIPWLIALPNRLLGAHVERWLWGFPLFAMCTYGWLLLELTTTGWGFLAGWTGIFLIFLGSRDLMHMFCAFFYGEAITSGLVGVLAAELYLRWQEARGRAGLRKTMARFFRPASGAGLGLLASFCILAKPPVGVLLPLFMPLAVVMALWARAWLGAALFFALAHAAPFGWKNVLASLGHAPEYNVSLADVLKSGINLDLIWPMLAGLVMYPGAPQFGLTLGLAFALCVAALSGEKKLFAWMVTVATLYWGFVFGLYATLWQRGDFTSAARYIAHAAVAMPLLLPLAFPRKKHL